MLEIGLFLGEAAGLEPLRVNATTLFQLSFLFSQI